MVKLKLNETHEELAREWHPTKNGDLKPQDVTRGSRKKAWWVCSKNNEHEWQAVIKDRTRARASGCPTCKKWSPTETNNLEVTHYEIAKEWHPIKNGEEKPREYTYGSGKKVWWMCSKDNKHEWEATITGRTRGRGCPYCSGKKVSETNNLLYVNEELAKEWHPTKNGNLQPKEVVRYSMKKVWWVCKKDDSHEWEATVARRMQGSGCPKCKSNGWSKSEYEIMYFLEKNNVKTIHRYKTKDGEIDIYLPEYNVAIEYNGEYFHKTKRKTDEKKFKRLKEKYNLILVNERELEGFENLNIEGKKLTQLYNRNPQKQDFEYIKKIFEILKIKSKVEINKRENLNILKMMNMDEKNNNVLEDEKLKKEWHYEKNKGLNPKEFTLGSGERVWWKCSKEKEHEWDVRINSRSKGSSCPYCSKGVDSKNNLVITHPKLALEWHPMKNGELKALYYKNSSKKKVWWRCSINNEHEWEASIKSRADGSKCPHCKTLTMTHPEIAKRLHPTKNEKEVKELTHGSGQKVWWICKENPKHEWQAKINNVVNGSGCPHCKKSKIAPERLLANRNPKIAKEWHPTKNKHKKLEECSYGSEAKVWWICSENKEHEWEQSVVSRTSKKNSRCPRCKEEHENIEKTHPQLLKEWNFEKNKDIKPNQFTHGSSKKVWWVCSKNKEHEWEAIIGDRTRGRNCPHCYNEKRKKKK